MKTKKKKGTAKTKVTKKEIREYYFMIPAKTNVKELASYLDNIAEEKIELWLELDLMEVILDHDSLIFQNAAEVFEDPEDLAFIASHKIETLYQVSFDAEDMNSAKLIFGQLLTQTNGLLCSDTEDFTPIYEKSSISTL